MTNLKIKRITIDTCCVNANQNDSHLNQIENWDKKGKVKLQRADAFLNELKGPPKRIQKGESIEKHPETITLGDYVLGSEDVLAGPDLEPEIRSILFPSTKTLNENQKKDVEHLQQHVRTGGDIFVTSNTNDFIKNGKQDALTKIGICVLTPEAAVEHIKKFKLLA